MAQNKSALAVGFVMATLFVSLSALAQTTYDSTTLVDTNNTSNSNSTVNSTNNTTTNNTSTVNSTNSNTNTNTNYNVNSGTTTVNNNNNNTGTMTYNNNNNTTSNNTNTNVNTSTSTNTNTNINTGEMTYNNNNNTTSNNTNTNNSTSNNTNTNTNVNQNTSTSNNVNQNIQSGEMTNKNINETTMRVEQPPPTAVAPAMMSGGNNDLCTTGTSGSVQTQIFGVSSGGTVRDMNCERIKLSKNLYDMGMKVAAVANLCQDRRVWEAMMMAGTPCPAEGMIGAQAKEYWTNNPEKIPAPEKVQSDDTLKKIGLGSLLGVAVFGLATGGF